MPKKISNVAMQNKVAEQLQKLVRLKYADKNGYVRCVTCGHTGFWEKDGMQGGHFLERAKLRLVEENIHPQCEGCNGFKMKHSVACVLDYEDFMVDTYGRDFVDDLRRQARQPQKYSMPELRDMMAEIKAQIAEISKEKGL